MNEGIEYSVCTLHYIDVRSDRLELKRKSFASDDLGGRGLGEGVYRSVASPWWILQELIRDKSGPPEYSNSPPFRYTKTWSGLWKWWEIVRPNCSQISSIKAYMHRSPLAYGDVYIVQYTAPVWEEELHWIASAYEYMYVDVHYSMQKDDMISTYPSFICICIWTDYGCVRVRDVSYFQCI